MTSVRVSGRSCSKTYGKGYDSSVMRHISDFPEKVPLRESHRAELSLAAAPSTIKGFLPVSV